MSSWVPLDFRTPKNNNLKKFHFKEMYGQDFFFTPDKKKQSAPQVQLPGFNCEKTFLELFTSSRHHFSGSCRQSVYMLPWVITLVVGQIIGQPWCSHKHCQSAAVSVMSTSMFHHLMSSRGVKRWLEHKLRWLYMVFWTTWLHWMENEPLSLLHIIFHVPFGLMCWKGAWLEFFFLPIFGKRKCLPN